MTALHFVTKLFPLRQCKNY